jgi:hypothetical protein
MVAHSFCLMRGYFDPIDYILETAYEFCSQEPQDSELLLFDCLWISGCTRLQLNEFEQGAKFLEQGYTVLQQAVSKGFILANDDRIAIASGLMGNGQMALNRFSDAERWYMKAFEMWSSMDDDVFLDKQLFVSAKCALISYMQLLITLGRKHYNLPCLSG